MTLRTDHITGAIAIVFGLAVIAMSGELPIGSLSFPGAGLWPKLLAALMIVLGLVLLVGAREGEAFATVRWDDLGHALPVMVIALIAVALYERLGFIISMSLMLFALALLKKKPVLHAAVFGAGVSVATYALFTILL
jgi:hypothetical protein